MNKIFTPCVWFSVSFFTFVLSLLCIYKEWYFLSLPYMVWSASFFMVGMGSIILNNVLCICKKMDGHLDKSEALCKEGVKEIDVLLTKMHRKLDGIQNNGEPKDVGDRLEKAKGMVNQALVLCEEIRQEIKSLL